MANLTNRKAVNVMSQNPIRTSPEVMRGSYMGDVDVVLDDIPTVTHELEAKLNT